MKKLWRLARLLRLRHCINLHSDTPSANVHVLRSTINRTGHGNSYSTDYYVTGKTNIWLATKDNKQILQQKKVLVGSSMFMSSINDRSTPILSIQTYKNKGQMLTVILAWSWVISDFAPFGGQVMTRWLPRLSETSLGNWRRQWTTKLEYLSFTVEAQGCSAASGSHFYPSLKVWEAVLCVLCLLSTPHRRCSSTFSNLCYRWPLRLIKNRLFDE